MSAHSVISPSSSSRWGATGACPASAVLEAQYPEGDKSAANEGDASHWVASTALLGGWEPPLCSSLVGQTAPIGVIVDEHMADAAAVYVAAIYAITREALRIERPVQIPRVNPACFGTPDCWHYDAARGVLHIFDYKYGYGIVEAFENWQAICYYAGIVDELGIPDQHLRVVIHIVQPRPYHMDGPARTWETTGAELRNFVNQLHNAAGEALGGTPRYVSGPHCRYCKGRHACLSAQQAAYYSVDVSGTAPGRDLTPEEVGIELAILGRAAKAMEYRITGLEAQGLELARKGKIIPGRRIGHGAGSTIWTKPVREVIALGDLMEIDVRQPEAAITPKQAETKGLSKEILKGYSEHRTGKARLVVDNNTKARQIFGGTAA